MMESKMDAIPAIALFEACRHFRNNSAVGVDLVFHAAINFPAALGRQRVHPPLSGRWANPAPNGRF